LVVVVVGCAKGPPEPVDPDRACEALRTALDAWKSGATTDTLKSGQPPIYVNDSDWLAGHRLTSYELKANGKHYGAQYRCWVVLSLESSKGKRSDKTVKYLIDTHPRVVIVRDDL
jgi:hypothetical protein